jgi:hypothetical protein
MASMERMKVADVERAASRTPRSARGGFRDELTELPYKVRLGALWVLCAIAFFAYRTLALADGATEVSVLHDDFGPYLLVMLGCAFLALVLPASWNRLTNLIAGSIVGIGQTIMLGDGMTGYPSATFNLMTAATVVAMAAVVWLAYRWGKRPA